MRFERAGQRFLLDRFVVQLPRVVLAGWPASFGPDAGGPLAFLLLNDACQFQRLSGDPLRDDPDARMDYADKMLSQILRITLDPTREADVHGHKLTFLPNLSQDLQESGAPLKLSADVLDSAIVEAATAAPSSRPILDYLIPCWHRVIRAIKVFRGPAPEKEEVLREARRICFSNCIFALTMPELFR